MCCNAAMHFRMTKERLSAADFVLTVQQRVRQILPMPVALAGPAGF